MVRQGATVREVNPRLTAHQRRQGRERSKTDRVDALAIARLVQQEHAHLPAVQRDDASAMLAVQVAARDGLVADLTALRNQLHQHLVQLESVRSGPWPQLTTAQGVARLTTFLLSEGDAFLQAHAQQVRMLATRMQLAMAQIAQLRTEIEAMSASWTEPLQAIVGVGCWRRSWAVGCLPVTPTWRCTRGWPRCRHPAAGTCGTA